MGDKKPCVVCRSWIDLRAEKCVTCGSYQDRSRYLVKYSALGAALLALVPFVPIAVSLWKIAFGSKEAEIRAAALTCREDGIEVGFANRGDVGGIVTRVSLANADELKLPGTFSMRAVDEGGTFIVNPGGAVQIARYQAYIASAESTFPAAPAGMEGCEYVISVEAVSFVGDVEPKMIRCDCPRS